MASPNIPAYSKEDIDLLSLDAVQKIQATHNPAHNAEITPRNVYQEAVLEGQPEFEEFVKKFLLPGSQVDGLEHIAECLNSLNKGKSVILLPEHRGNLDVPTFHVLLRGKEPQHEDFLQRLIYIAGRKLNESSDFVRMFTEKYSRLVIVPRRDLPSPSPEETAAEIAAREDYEQLASRINRAAFRELVKLRKAGKVFVLFPLGGRLKPDADNIPVRETISYLKAFDEAYLVSMEGNLLQPRPRMEDERPRQDKVVFRMGRPLQSKAFLEEQLAIFDRAIGESRLGPQPDFEQFTVERIMTMLEALRTQGDFDTAFPA